MKRFLDSNGDTLCFKRSVLLAVVGCVLATSIVQGQRPELSGRWRLETVEGQPLTATLCGKQCTISVRDGLLEITRADRAFSFMLDGRERTEVEVSTQVTTVSRWEGSQVVIIRTTRGELSLESRLSIALENGRLVIEVAGADFGGAGRRRLRAVYTRG